MKRRFTVQGGDDLSKLALAINYAGERTFTVYRMPEELP